MIRPTLDDLHDELAKGSITETELRDPGLHLDGFYDSGSRRVYVNPKPGIVETVLHELIHRRWPKWGEARVDKEAKRLLCRMSDAQVADFYRKYKGLARTRKRPKVIE